MDKEPPSAVELVKPVSTDTKQELMKRELGGTNGGNRTTRRIKEGGGEHTHK